MKTQALVVSDDPVYLNWLQKAAPGADFSLVRPLHTDDLVGRLAGARADLIFFQFDRDNVAIRAATMEQVLERQSDLAVAGIGEQDEPSVVLAAMRSGARDFLVLKRDEDNVAALISRLLKRSAQVSAPSRSRGRLHAVLGAYPHDGIAFLAEHVALASAERLAVGERALLLDLAAPYGACAVFLNLNQTYGVLDALQDVHRFDATLIETTFAKHRSGVYVLSLPEDLSSRPAFDEDELRKLLSVARDHFACTVIAIDGQLPLPAVKVVCTQADRAMVVTEQSILQSRHTKHLLRGLRAEDCAMDRIGLVVDNYRKRLGLEPQNLAELFEMPLLASLATQPGNRIQAMNAGEPMFTSAPKDEWCSGVRALVSALAGEARAVTASTGLLGKLLGGGRT